MFQPIEILLGFPFYNLIEDCSCLYEYKSEPRCYPIARYNTARFQTANTRPKGRDSIFHERICRCRKRGSCSQWNAPTLLLLSAISFALSVQLLLILASSPAFDAFPFGIVLEFFSL